MRSKWIGYALVAGQLITFFYIFLTGPWAAQAWFWLAVEIAGGALGIWAILAMRLGNFNVTPEVKAETRLVRRGPYRWIRHPMYTSLLLIALALVVTDFTWDRALMLVALAAVLVTKLTYEEKLLSQAFADYAAYRQATKRLIPFVY
jgi:protein-S-isoprenylcysteine O-methyltransferase Ste14